MRVGSLFSGIGGIDLGLERAGMEIAWQVEIDELCRQVLTKHWPDVPKYGDIRECGSHNLAAVDVLAGGFPCQPVSSAGRQLGLDDPRWLWPHFHRLIRDLRPRFVFVENVRGLLNRGMDQVLGDLAASGFDAEWECIPASALGASHQRDRVWLIAYPAGERLPRSRIFGCHAPPACDWETSDALDALARRDVPVVCRDHARLSRRVDEARRHALGNAVVPQIVEWIGRRLMAMEAE